MSELDKSEYGKIEKAIEAAEQSFSKEPLLSRDRVAAAIEPGKRRLETFHQEGFDPSRPDGDRKRRESNSVAIAVHVMQETQLNARERETFASFLHQDFFTRSDFKKLEAFYADGGAWDRLSDDGKKEMSQRFWSGVEQGEYHFEEAPSNVRNKEADQLAFYLKNPEKAPEVVQRMSPAAKEDFIQAYESGDRKSAQEVLSSNPLFESSPLEKTQAATQRSEGAASREGNTKTDRTESKEQDKLEDTSKDAEALASLGDISEFSPTALPKKPAGNSQIEI